MKRGAKLLESDAICTEINNKDRVNKNAKHKASIYYRENDILATNLFL